MFYQLDWQQMEKNWKVICTASFFFIVTHYSRFCSLISASSALSMHGEKGGSCSTSAFMVCFLSIQLGGVSLRITAKEQLRLNVLSFISISMQRFEVRPPAGTTPIFNFAPAALRPIISYQRIVSAFKSPVVPYLAASPQSQDKVLFSQLTGGWCWTPPPPPPPHTRCPSMDAKGHSWSVPPHTETIPITTEGPLGRHRGHIAAWCCHLAQIMPYMPLSPWQSLFEFIPLQTELACRFNIDSTTHLISNCNANVFPCFFNFASSLPFVS